MQKRFNWRWIFQQDILRASPIDVSKLGLRNCTLWTLGGTLMSNICSVFTWPLDSSKVNILIFSLFVQYSAKAKISLHSRFFFSCTFLQIQFSTSSIFFFFFSLKTNSWNDKRNRRKRMKFIYLIL